MSDEMIELVLNDVNDKMEKSVQHTQEGFAGVRTGRASTSLVEKLMVNNYGAAVPLQQIAGLSVPEPQTILISPYDPNSLEGIEKAIQESDLGLTPNSDGAVVRIAIPALTEERRKDMVKIAKGLAEEGKVSIRNCRRAARAELTQLNKDSEISKDDLQRGEKELDEMTHQHENTIDEGLESKEKELMET